MQFCVCCIKSTPTWRSWCVISLFFNSSGVFNTSQPLVRKKTRVDGRSLPDLLDNRLTSQGGLSMPDLRAVSPGWSWAGLVLHKGLFSTFLFKLYTADWDTEDLWSACGEDDTVLWRRWLWRRWHWWWPVCSSFLRMLGRQPYKQKHHVIGEAVKKMGSAPHRRLDHKCCRGEQTESYKGQ